MNKCLKNIIYNAFLDSDVSAEYGFLRLTLVQTGAAHSVMYYIKTSQMDFICHITNEAVAVVSGAEVFQLDW